MWSDRNQVIGLVQKNNQLIACQFHYIHDMVSNIEIYLVVLGYHHVVSPPLSNHTLISVEPNKCMDLAEMCGW